MTVKSSTTMSVQTRTEIRTTTLFFGPENSMRGLTVFKLLLNDCEFKKTFNLTKFHIFNISPMVYYLHGRDHFCKSLKLTISWNDHCFLHWTKKSRNIYYKNRENCSSRKQKEVRTFIAKNVRVWTKQNDNIRQFN